MLKLLPHAGRIPAILTAIALLIAALSAILVMRYLWRRFHRREKLQSGKVKKAVGSENSKPSPQPQVNLEEALARFERIVALKPEHAEAWKNRGTVLLHLWHQAENRGTAAENLWRLNEALLSVDRAIALRSDYAEAWNNRGAVLHQLGRLDEALASFEQAIHFNPDF